MTQINKDQLFGKTNLQLIQEALQLQYWRLLRIVLTEVNLVYVFLLTLNLDLGMSELASVSWASSTSAPELGKFGRHGASWASSTSQRELGKLA